MKKSQNYISSPLQVILLRRSNGASHKARGRQTAGTRLADLIAMLSAFATRCRRSLALAGAALLLGIFPAGVLDAAATLALDGPCAGAIEAAERRHAIPRRLLAAVALAESGRWDEERAATVAWPWTVMAEGVGKFFPSRDAAIVHVLALRARGVRNIDVGCMQVNLMHHPNAFPSLEAAFDPASNADYAGRFLASLNAEERSWPQAVAHYHSRTRALAQPYRAKVLGLWSRTHGVTAATSTAAREAAQAEQRAESERRRAAAAAYRAAVIAAWEAQRRDEPTAVADAR
ncbi:MAG: transglycosylase SLT domain-containing protein [Alphaproteobacteria bacterium]